MHLDLSTTQATTHPVPHTDAATVRIRVIDQTRNHELYWVLCPHCGQPMHYSDRPHNGSTKTFGKCLNPDCGYHGWIEQIDADVWAFVQLVHDGQVAA